MIDYRLIIPMLAPVQRSNLRSHITAHLFDAILHRELRPGERIIEGKYARGLGVAQSTFREALQELEHQGLVTKSDRRGTFVTKLSVSDVDDLYVVRLELEPLAAALASQRMTREHFRHLEDILRRMKDFGRRRDFVQLLKTDLRFHQSIWKFSGNQYVEKALNVVCPPLFASYMIRAVSGDLYDYTNDHDEHVAMLAALKKGGPPQVAIAFRSMVEVFRIQDVENLRKYEAAHETASSESGEGVGVRDG